jgi:hypothetical protein
MNHPCRLLAAVPKQGSLTFHGSRPNESPMKRVGVGVDQHNPAKPQARDFL